MRRIVNTINDLIETADGQIPDFRPDRTKKRLTILFGEDPLKGDGLKPSESIPPRILGNTLEDMVKAVANRLQTPTGLAAACALGTVSAAMGRGLYVPSRPGMVIYPNIYILVGTPSGGFKSVTAAPILDPLRKLHEERIARWRNNEFPKLMAENDSLDGERKLLLKPKRNEVSPAGKKGRLTEIHRRLQEIEIELLEPRLFVENATTEALARQMGVSNGVLASISSDAREQIKIVAGKYRNQGETDEGLYLKAWCNESYDSPRIGRKVKPMESTCLVCLFLTQPDMVRKMFGIAGFTDGGLMPRFLTCTADYPPKELKRDEIEPRDTISPEWDALIKGLFAEYHDAKPRQLQITAEAVAVFDAHYNSIAAQYQSLRIIWPYAARWTEQAWKLVIILHAALHGRKAHLEPIQADTARAAVAIADWFRGHQLAILGQSQIMRLSELIQRVLELFKTASTTVVTATDLTRKRIVPDAEKAKALLELMCPQYLTCKEYTPKSGGYTVKYYCPKETIPAAQAPERDARVARVAQDAQPKEEN